MSTTIEYISSLRNAIKLDLARFLHQRVAAEVSEGTTSSMKSSGDFAR